MIALDYHQATKHSFHRFARSAGYLDWATQPDPFRRFAGATLVPLPRAAPSPAVAYEELFLGHGAIPPVPIDIDSIGAFLRCSMGLSAWKQYGASRWALRVNPSSGNLHPTETYIVWGAEVCHYAPREHGLEKRAAFGAGISPIPESTLLVGLTSVHWREAWKYGERAFRYCQHDAGHAIAALRLAAAMLGWRLELLPGWSHADIAAVLGVDRDADFADAEHEEPECIALVTAAGASSAGLIEASHVVGAARSAIWQGSANRLSPKRVAWPLIDEVAEATRFSGAAPGSGDQSAAAPPEPPAVPQPPTVSRPQLSAASVILQRRSALGFDPRGVLRRETFLSMLARLQPGAAPWDAVEGAPLVQLALFVHRVLDVTPGLYVYLRGDGGGASLKAAMRGEFLWEQAADGLFLLAPVDVQPTAIRLSCDQDIAGDGFFSLGMLAPIEASLAEHGEWYYRRLFWECGMVGQVLYLEAEAAGARGTGIGCFYDDPVHEVLGFTDRAWQSLYHFSMGVPVDDGRLTTAPGYEWEETGGRR